MVQNHAEEPDDIEQHTKTEKYLPDRNTAALIIHKQSN